MCEKVEIKRFFECLIPITVCNLKCNYCYVIQRNYRNMKPAQMKYSVEHIGKCLTKDRLGGVCYFSICGAGETMAQNELLPLVKVLLQNGHFVNITTNGTLTKKFDELELFDKELLSRLHFSFSFHYNELIKKNLLNTFFNNVRRVKKIGCSFMVQLNLCDEYIEKIEEIKRVCKENIGAYPQLAATRKENGDLKNIELLTNKSKTEYVDYAKSFDSKLFEYTMKNFNKKRKEFCYAGERSGVLNLATGELKKCYGDPFKQNIFKNPNKKIKFEAVGNNCYSCFCLNSSHFMSLGVIDRADSDDNYVSIRNRKEASWFNDTCEKSLSVNLKNTNKKYSKLKKIQVNIKEKVKKIIISLKNIIKKIVRYNNKCQEPKN